MNTEKLLEINVEDNIMDIIHDLYKRNQIITIKRVYDLCSRIFGLRNIEIDGMTILNAIERLQREKRICFGQKIIRDFILANKGRKEIYQYLKKNPGSRASDISKNIKMALNLLQWNLAILLRYQCLIEVPVNITKIYGTYQDSPETLLIAFFFRDTDSNKILQMLKEGTYSKQYLVDLTSLSYNTVIYNLKLFIQHSLIDVSFDGSIQKYQLKTSFKTILLKLIK